MKILLGMSGGVDSTYSALKLIKEGHTVEGCMLLMHEYTDTDSAALAAKELGIPLHIIDCRSQFDEVIKPYFIGEYLNARTPNPCIVCNPKIKFKYLLEFAKQNGFDKIATGHYARIVKLDTECGVRYAAAVAEDTKKDQSYMLSRLGQDALSMLVLPLSDITKGDVRKESEQGSLSAAKSRDSQEICFIPDGDYAAYIEAAAGKSREGDFISEDGKPLGKHSGIIRYTVGQRKGLGIALGGRAFVTEISPEKNTVTLSFTPRLDSKISLSEAVYSGICCPKDGTALRVYVKVRYTAPMVPATAVFFGDKIELMLDTPARSVTPGQAAVLYDKDGAVLVGAFIEKTI